MRDVWRTTAALVALVALASCSVPDERPTHLERRNEQRDAEQTRLVKRYLAAHYSDASWYDEVLASLDISLGELSVEMTAGTYAVDVCRALDQADAWQVRRTNSAIVPISVLVDGNEAPPAGCQYLRTNRNWD